MKPEPIPRLLALEALIWARAEIETNCFKKILLIERSLSILRNIAEQVNDLAYEKGN